MARSSSRRLAGLLLVAALAPGCATTRAISLDARADHSEESLPAPSAESGPVRILDEVPAMHPSIDGYGTAEVELSSPDGSSRWILPVRVADDPTERAHGFMEVPAIPTGTGMLFTFEDVGERTGGFWMKNTLVPLDIAYMDADGVVVTAYRMEPCTTEACSAYPSPAAPYLTTLEVPAGFFAAIGLEVGWTVRER